ncbi:MAG: exo-alpha-sialidase [Prevotella sp.]|nr:exo-alpha-sialidase [Prevotella sp.]
MNYKLSLCACLLCCNSLAALADTPPFTIAQGLFDASQKETMGLSYAPGAETFTVWAAQDQGNHYANGVVLTAFKGNMYCMWQTSAKDEDADDTYVAYAISQDGGMTWSEPMVLCPTVSNGYCASGGWLSTGDLLVGYINVRTKDIADSGGYTQYVESSDGLNWTQPKDVTMADGSQLNGIFEQDPHVLSDGRIIGAAHFQPGLKLCPIYTDDPTGRTGWKKGQFQYTANGTQSAELEPSFFQQHDGTLVMVCRDQKGSYHTLAATSQDRGETWTKAVQTDMPDSRAKQCAGNLPDGTVFYVNNPGRVTNASNTTWRVPLTVSLSADGTCFTEAYLLRSGQSGDYPARRYEGKAKTLGYSYPKALVHNGYLYVSYATNKDDAQLTRVPINNIMLGISTPMIAANDLFTLRGRHLNLSQRGSVEIYELNGTLALRMDGITEASLDALPSGLYAIRVKGDGATTTRKVVLR